MLLFDIRIAAAARVYDHQLVRTDSSLQKLDAFIHRAPAHVRTPVDLLH